jgi:methyl-accepting chemotaxis protein
MEGISMKKSSIKMTVLVPALSALAIGVAVMVLLVSIFTTAATENLTDRLVNARVNEYTNQFSAISNKGYAMATSLVPIVDTLVQTSTDPRTRITQVLEEMLISDSSLLGVWACFEPNALDGKDADFVNAEHHDATGRYIPSATRDESGNVVVVPLADYETSDYYTGARDSGKPYITDPYDYGGISLYSIATPILHDGAVIGVVGMDISLEDLTAIFNAGSILDDGNLSVISPSGLFTTSQTEALVLQDYKNIWLSEFSADIDKILANGGTFEAVGYSDVLAKDVQVSITGVMIGDTGRYWEICGLVPMDNITAESTRITWLVIGSGVGLVLLTGLIILIVVRRATRRLPMIAELAERVALGDVNITDLDASTEPTQNEVTLLERAFGHIIEAVHDQADKLDAIAKGDYTVQIAVRSEADVMNRAINTMLDSNNSVLSQIHMATGQVSAGASQIADGAQSLAQGSTEQAATVQELSAAIANVAAKTKTNAERADHSAELADSIKNNAEKGNRQMKDMVAAVGEISKASQDIGRVIKVIDDIAFQTNILALNASVEAARAGQHGKGFAVVAEDVRNLAAKSAEAAKDTGALIASSIEKAELGSRIAKETEDSLVEIVAGVEESSEVAREIAVSSKEQSDEVVLINNGIEQVAMVVQQNSATAEESAAASEEMSGQSEMLKELVSQFKLRNLDETAPASAMASLPARSSGFSLAQGGATKY